MSFDQKLNAQQLPDGSLRIIAANEHGQLIIEQYEREFHARYRRLLPELEFTDVVDSHDQRDAIAAAKSRLWAFDSSVRNDLFRILKLTLPDDGEPADMPLVSVRRSEAILSRQDATLVVGALEMESRGLAQVLHGTSIRDSLNKWLAALVYADAKARDAALDQCLKAEDRGYGGTGSKCDREID